MCNPRRVKYEQSKQKRNRINAIYEEALLGMTRTDIAEEFKISESTVLNRIRETDPDFKFKKGRRKKDYKNYQRLSEEKEEKRLLKEKKALTRQEIIEKYYYAFFPFDIRMKVRGLRKQSSDITKKMWEIRELRSIDGQTSEKAFAVLNQLQEERDRLNKMIAKFQNYYMTKLEYAIFRSKIEEIREMK